MMNMKTGELWQGEIKKKVELIRWKPGEQWDI